jgi:hypothetical protein
MKKILLVALIIIPFLKTNGQGIGEMAPEKPPVLFPPHAWGIDIMFGEGGVGVGGFYRKEVFPEFTFFTDLSFSEAKDEKEIEYIDYWGQTFVLGKKNRIFLLPAYVGIQYRLFGESLTDNLRPYVNFGIGPTMVITNPYEKEFFSAFKYAQAKYTLGGYIGFGANFGLDQEHLLGINIRYYHIQFFNKGVEGLLGRFKKELGGVYLTINIGSMY